MAIELNTSKYAKPGAGYLPTNIHACPCCGAEGEFKLYKESPYAMCGICDFWFQDPLPPKSFESLEEKGEDGRSGGKDQPASYHEASAHLARCFARNWILKMDPIGRATHKAIDIGCKYPMFAHTLKKEFGMDAYGMDGMDMDDPNAPPILAEYEKELGVPMLVTDFESIPADDILAKTQDGQPFDAISMVHVFEHMYDPVAAFEKLHALLWHDGVLLIRMPSHEVPGIECHLSHAHYSIHPYFYSEQSFRNMLAKTVLHGHEGGPLFEIVETYPLGGAVRDYILKPR